MNERYELLAPIGEGGMGTVFKARDRRTGRVVALKRLRADQATDAAAIDRFLHEARLLSELRHPNIVEVLDAGVEDGIAFMAMEFIQGETLDAVVKPAALKPEAFDSLVRQTLAGMSGAHTAGVLHLDLKPENLMLSPRPEGGFQVKILDFGLARGVNDGVEPADGLPGSVFFMAPEQFQRGAVDARADVYALGCVFYHALTQRHPFEGELAPQVVVSHLRHWVKPLAPLRPDLPVATIQWIERLISRQPADRPASAKEALDAYPGVI